MTQDEMQRLLIEIIDEFEFIVWYQKFLKIAVEHFDNPNDETLDRVDLLLSTYLSIVEPHFKQIEYYIRRRDESLVEVSTDNQS